MGSDLTLTISSPIQIKDVIGSDFDDSITGNSNANNIMGGDGNDTIAAGDGNDSIDGGAGDDIVNAESGVDTIHGGSGADILIGGNGADSLTGGDGEDIIISGAINLTGGTFITFVNAVHAEWLSTNSYATRVANIQDGTGGSSHNGSNYLDGTAIDNDAAVDAVFGEDATPDNEDDWFLVDMTTDSTTDAVSGEEIDDIVTY
jgi:Ca2+-binding RTX toxin-like protein